MASKSKRKNTCNDASGSKKPKIHSSETPVRRDLLDRCYARVTTLREHILSNLPSSSRLRRKKIASLGQKEGIAEIEAQLVHLLDTSLVCTHQPQPDPQDTRWEQWVSFSQKGDESNVTISDGLFKSKYSQSEIVDFVIWLLFSRELKAGKRPKHLLCDGFRRGAAPGDQGGAVVPGLFSLYPNSNVKALREAPWPHLLALLGQSGEKMMIDLLLDGSIYMALQAGFRNYRQLSDILNRCSHTLKATGLKNEADHSKLEMEQRHNTIKVMMYMFPRQFGLHNVFTSQIDTSRTAQQFQDYTLREDEITLAFPQKPDKQDLQLPKLPKRLRGDAERLVGRLQVRHDRCSFIELLRHYCPCALDVQIRNPRPAQKKDSTLSYKEKSLQTTLNAPSQGRRTTKKQSRKPQPSTQVHPPPQPSSLVELATPLSQVSAFCQAVLSKVIPNQFWGDGETQSHNKAMILQKVDHFVKLRRFETMSLHEISQDLKITDISWLQPPGLRTQKPSQTDTTKRHEIFYELLYYTFDSLLIPLIRSNFYVTESNSHRYQVFYFRHEIWKYIAEPSMAMLKESMFEEVKLEDALQTLQSRRLGFSQIRLLPKGGKLRPIMNLRRRALTRGANKVLGPSINSILGPVHTLLKLEKTLNPSKLGSTMFSVSDIYARLKGFKERLGSNHGRLYFAKVDVQAAFDTIPQAAVINLMGSVPSQAKYTVTKHVEVKPGERAELQGDRTATKAIRRWHANALREGDVSGFSKRLETDLAGKKKNTIFVDSAVQKTHGVQELLSLLTQHVEQNLVKVGKKYYRQKMGIPQGSVLSSFLCNYFYADLERKHLGFLVGPDTLLLRLIDDFLLITLDRNKAIRFVETMHRGLPEYGVVVNPKKTLVNFDMWCSGGDIDKMDEGPGFPYCGLLIDCQTLDITKDRQRDLGIAASLTVDFGHAPGQNFQRKILRTITKTIDVAFLLLTGKSRKMRYPQYTCDIKKTQVALIACTAFTKVLAKKPAQYAEVVAWLRTETERLGSGKQRGARQVT
ncbi:hypothetical protein AK830_g10942 [Neonectria ditissima]|uniref:Telomerase reverse transcriptase n=1 Tax=Neonectria ditissima TaxID=78410 RepID=A0A0P7B642_9HYPO|nr:hypothetical protein AK830_g10942 [Neonectria ditissima]